MYGGRLGLPFVQTTKRIADTEKPVVLYTCVECRVTDYIALKSGSSLNPLGHNQQMRNRGWAVPKAKISKVYCPTCASARIINDVDSELRKFQGTPPTIMGELVPDMPSDLKQASTPGSNVATLVRAPTPEQRVAIRNGLDLHFDDARGHYIDGMDDDKLAQKLGVPRILVEQIRETAYGPIRSDPEIESMRTEVSELKRMITEYRGLQDNLRKALDTIESRTMALGSRMERRKI
jgi:hypothetical protein